MRLARTAAVLATVLLALPAGASARSAPAPKTMPPDLLLYYISKAPGAGEITIRFSGAGTVIHTGHRARSFRLDHSALCALRGQLRRAQPDVVHAPDGRVRDALYRLHPPHGRVGPFRRDSILELIAFGNARFAGRRLPEASLAQQRFLRYLDRLLRDH
ncbi:MAG: hypothetical protein QOJ97_279 [Solirubrobacteraceae bacterium]|jgi:hypothetical protein|nr:hypothetical protein [Solirubrobacteraceae bacterium]